MISKMWSEKEGGSRAESGIEVNEKGMKCSMDLAACHARTSEVEIWDRQHDTVGTSTTPPPAPNAALGAVLNHPNNSPEEVPASPFKLYRPALSCAAYPNPPRRIVHKA